MVHHDAFTFQHQADPTVAKPAALPCNLAHFSANIGIIRHFGAAHSLGIDADQSAGSALADVVSLHRLDRRCPLILGRRHGFASRLVPMAALAHPKRSFKTTLSSIASASNLFSLAFSCSKAFSRRASFGMASYRWRLMPHHPSHHTWPSTCKT